MHLFTDSSLCGDHLCDGERSAVAFGLNGVANTTQMGAKTVTRVSRCRILHDLANNEFWLVLE